MVDEILKRLVAFDTRNPEGLEAPLLEYCGERLQRLRPDFFELRAVPRSRGGNPTGYVYACFGTPKLLVNAHVDTVPLTPGWSGSPFELRAGSGRLSGLGASDTKGSIAAVLAALEKDPPKDTALLFSGDEELGTEAIQAFLSTHTLSDLELAIVCEPTGGTMANEHRGIVYAEVTARGPGGHSSGAEQVPAPALVLSRLAARLGDWAADVRRTRPELCLNIAEIKTGAAFNVIPTAATLVLSLRPAPGVRVDDVKEEMSALVREFGSDLELSFPIANSSFRTLREGAIDRYAGAGAPRASVPFWTEAALMEERGYNAVVYGPGDIAQAHRPDESIGVDALQRGAALFSDIFKRTKA